MENRPESSPQLQQTTQETGDVDGSASSVVEIEASRRQRAVGEATEPPSAFVALISDDDHGSSDAQSNGRLVGAAQTRPVLSLLTERESDGPPVRRQPIPSLVDVHGRGNSRRGSRGSRVRRWSSAVLQTIETRIAVSILSRVFLNTNFRKKNQDSLAS